MNRRRAVRCQTLLWLGMLLVFTPASFAAIEITLQEPNWAFQLSNRPLTPTTAQLAPDESRFAQFIQPLLNAQDHDGVVQAFNGRPIEGDSAALRLLRGQVLLSLKRYPEAQLALQAALQLMPDLALAHRSLSLLHMLQQQYDQARLHLSRTIELGVADAQVYGQLAYVNVQSGRPASAVAGYQYALLLQPDNRQWQQGLLFALIGSQAFNQAQGLLDEMLRTQPQNADLWLQRGQLALHQERPLQALSSLEVAFELGVRDVQNIVTAAQLHIQNGSARRAVQLLQGDLQRLIDGSKVEVIEQVCAWLAYQQDWSLLESLLVALVHYRGELAESYQARFEVYNAQLELAKGNPKQAKASLVRAVTSDPANGEALLTLATLLRDQNQVESALPYFVRAEALPQYQERARLARAQLEIDRQNYSEALRLLRQVAEINPQRSDVLTNIQALENILRNQG